MVPTLFLLALAIGLMIPLQAAINQALAASLRSGALLAAFVSFAVGTGALGLVAVATGQPLGALGGLARVPWWQWLGGALGAFFVFGSTLLAPRIGLAALVLLVVLGQVTASLVYDHLGLMGLPVRSLTWTKALGAALVLAGVLLVTLGERS